jgi:uncharacterized protein (DUF934 family)
MALIKDRKLTADSWQLLEGVVEGAPLEAPASGDVIVPLGGWLTSREQLIAREGRLGVWLSGADEPEAVAADLDRFAVIAVQFASFTDGRGYSIGRLLRDRYGFRGELRAIGDIQRDQIFYLMRCGFDAFVLRPAEDVAAALAAFDDFSEPYQTSVERPLPLFRRRDITAPVQ